MKKKTNRTRIVGMRFTQDEFDKLNKQFKKTTCLKLSEYLRRLIFDKPVVTTYRNQSMDDFMAGMILLKAELNSIGNNFNQLVKKVNTYKDDRTISGLLAGYELDRRKLVRQVESIYSFIEKNAALW
ncbi:plasmid mobilization relaxosome protein MobC [Pedobacter sp. MC2016-24]|uniref:plasmid mobilization protein n=1 Tax=Pedobacter sp. MC2016-24 TaxID=2780090 RepID=UPI001D16AA21|nr:plasmid mobilization relaxosome protein MobC [Pedobacter sp. MC2016-24]